jgi:hypothetical protein
MLFSIKLHKNLRLTSYNYIPDSRFNSYDVRIDIPVTISFYYADIGII